MYARFIDLIVIVVVVVVGWLVSNNNLSPLLSFSPSSTSMAVDVCVCVCDGNDRDDDFPMIIIIVMVQYYLLTHTPAFQFVDCGLNLGYMIGSDFLFFDFDQHRRKKIWIILFHCIQTVCQLDKNKYR